MTLLCLPPGSRSGEPDAVIFALRFLATKRVKGNENSLIKSNFEGSLSLNHNI